MASRKESGSALSAGMSSTGGTLDSPVKQIQIEGLVSVAVDINGSLISVVVVRVSGLAGQMCMLGC